MNKRLHHHKTGDLKRNYYLLLNPPQCWGGGGLHYCSNL